MKRILPLFFATVLLTGCNTSTDVPFAENGSRLNVSVNINQTDSRAGIIKESALPDKSQIGISLVGALDKDYLAYKNICYTAQKVDGAQKWSAINPVLLSDELATVYSYYPYSLNANIEALNIETITQTDYMYGTPVPDVNEENSSVDITLNHALANVKFTINDEYYLGQGVLESVSIYGNGITDKGVFNAKTGKFVSLNDAGVKIKDEKSRQLKNAVSNLMVVPNGVEDAIYIELVIDGKTFNAQSQTLTVVKGKSYNFDLNIKGTYIEMSSCSVVPWVDVDYNTPLDAERTN